MPSKRSTVDQILNFYLKKYALMLALLVPLWNASLAEGLLQEIQKRVIQQSAIQPHRSTRCSSYMSPSRSAVFSSLIFCNRSLIYAAWVIWIELPKDILQFAHPSFSSQSHHLPSCPLSSSFPVTTESQTFKAITSWFYCCTTPWPPPPTISTVAPCYVLGLTSLDPDLPRKRPTWLFRASFDLTPVKLASIARFLFDAEKFWRFT